MILELRRYRVSDGCMDEMHLRMREMLMPLFEEHGLPRPVAIWETSMAGSVSMLVWMMRWRDFEHRRDSWAVFLPVWQQARARQDIEEFVEYTDLNLVDLWPGCEFVLPAGPACCEAVWYPQPRVGMGATFKTEMKHRGFDTMRDLGATDIAAFDLSFGPLPQSMILVSWPDTGLRAAALENWERSGLGNSVLCAAGSTSMLRVDTVWHPLDRTSYLDVRPAG